MTVAAGLTQNRISEVFYNVFRSMGGFYPATLFIVPVPEKSAQNRSRFEEMEAVFEMTKENIISTKELLENTIKRLPKDAILMEVAPDITNHLYEWESVHSGALRELLKYEKDVEGLPNTTAQCRRIKAMYNRSKEHFEYCAGVLQDLRWKILLRDGKIGEPTGETFSNEEEFLALAEKYEGQDR